MLEQLESLHLEQLGSYVDALNRGGCGWLALIISDELTERNIEHELILLTDAPEGTELIEDLEQFRWDYQLVHVMCKIDGYVLDCDGVDHNDNFKTNNSWGRLYNQIPMTREIISSWVEQTDNWNYAFDQSSVPCLREPPLCC